MIYVWVAAICRMAGVAVVLVATARALWHYQPGPLLRAAIPGALAALLAHMYLRSVGAHHVRRR